MARLTWIRESDRNFFTGLSKGVIYDGAGTGHAWDGLISINETNTSVTQKPIYQNGQLRSRVFTPGEFDGTIEAYSYPRVASLFFGDYEISEGLYGNYLEQPRFSMSWEESETVGNTEYRIINVLYNLKADPADSNAETITDTISPETFSWTVLGHGVEVPGFRDAAHIKFRERRMKPIFWQKVTEALYGTDTKDSKLPTVVEFMLISYEHG